LVYWLVGEEEAVHAAAKNASRSRRTKIFMATGLRVRGSGSGPS
jgi:hypothetical protein